MTKLTDEAVNALLDGATPGPWAISDVSVQAADKSLIALVYGSGRGSFEDNRKLVAAAPDLARAFLDARADNARLRADAQAAVALVVEKAVEAIKGLWKWDDDGWLVERPDMKQAEAAIRALADTDGLAMVEALRKERDDAVSVADANWVTHQQVVSMRARAEKAEADLAAAQAQIEALRDFLTDFASAKIDALRYRPAYGESPEDEPDPVVEAETVWAWQADAKAALAALPAKDGE